MHGIANLGASFYIYGKDFNNPFRLAWDFWQNRRISVISAAMYYTPMVLWATGSLFSRRNIVKRITAILVIVVGILATLLYQNRTLIFAIGIVVAARVLFLLQDNNVSMRIKRTLISSFLFLAVLFIIVWVADIAGISTFVKSTAFYARLIGATGEGFDRPNIWASFILGDAWKYPFGGTKAVLYRNKPYVHNMWLDIWRRTGIIPFLTFLIFTISSVKTVAMFIRYSKEKEALVHTHEDYHAIASALLGLSSVFFLEPVIENNPYIFYLPILIIGAMNGRMLAKGDNLSYENSICF